MRMQDAVPDELEIIPDGEKSKHASGVASQNSSPAGVSIPVPKTVVQAVDPISPGHGDAPRIIARSTHKADAVPDVVVQVNDSVDSEDKSEGHSKSRFCWQLFSERLTGVRFTNTCIEQIHIFPGRKLGVVG